MLSIPSLVSRIVTSGEDEEDHDQWPYTTYGSRNKKRLTILTA